MTNEKAVAEKLLQIQAIKLSPENLLPGQAVGKALFIAITEKYYPIRFKEILLKVNYAM